MENWLIHEIFQDFMEMCQHFRQNHSHPWNVL